MKILSDKHGEKYNVVINDDEYGSAFKVITADNRTMRSIVQSGRVKQHEAKPISILRGEGSPGISN